MRLLTDSERDAQKTSLREYWVERDGLLPKEQRAFEAGFTAALDHAAAQIAALTAALRQAQDTADGLRDQLQAMLNVFGHPDLPEGSIARYACDEARKQLNQNQLQHEE